MFRSLFPLRRLLATSFLLVFVNVFVGQCWCATMNPEPAGRMAVVEPPVAAQPTHPGCPGHGAVAEYPTTKPDKHPAKSAGSQDDCCKDNSAALLSALTTPAQKALFTPAPAVLPTAIEFHFRPLAGKWDQTATVALVPPRHLKPKIPDIRIYIQSLTV
ncbi:hypothetical protein D0N36_16295 [Hymenobacter lapidiphilus]|uniref:hypothetical protein n=1 Tax=Hymenobacter sp. CCM 8763 TaxID=2303334 RepID=UPI000E34E722|nr:hypothetical protein [Hymenobacter sp. CCM 8763]RFP64001.1 hypothetical protein D0N36_16295 [Hymenobacter sp. CCM 8763]